MVNSNYFYVAVINRIATNKLQVFMIQNVIKNIAKITSMIATRI